MRITSCCTKEMEDRAAEHIRGLLTVLGLVRGFALYGHQGLGPTMTLQFSTQSHPASRKERKRMFLWEEIPFSVVSLLAFRVSLLSQDLLA